jgi:integrase/recombinase XerD
MTDSFSNCEVWLSRLNNHLCEERYSFGYVRRCIGIARNFLVFLHKQHTAILDVQPSTVDRYLKMAQQKYRQHHGESPAYKGWRNSQTNSIHMLLRMVRSQWPPALPAGTPSELYAQELCEGYATSMTDMRGLAAQTVSGRCEEARRFLRWLGGPVNREALTVITVTDVDMYMKNRAASLRRVSIKGVAKNLGSFLRWLNATGISARDLSKSVIAPSLYAFDSIPSALRSRDVENVLSATRRDRSPMGLRDYAILMLLARYGLRAGEITGLRLDDVDWRKEVIRIRHTKTAASSWLPLLPEVGEAILRYLQKARPQTSLREIFIRSIAPYRPFKSGSSLYTPVRCRIDAAGISAGGKRGPHAFRHACAVSMTRASVPLKEIGDLLGHRSAESTLVYLKLATEDLRAVALEIPVEVKP